MHNQMKIMFCTFCRVYT